MERGPRTEEREERHMKRFLDGESLIADAWRTARTSMAWGSERLAGAVRRAAGAGRRVDVAPSRPERALRRAPPACVDPTPRTLAELGIPRDLALRLEDAFRATGATHGDRVVGFTFKANDGTRYTLRTASRPDSSDRAA